MFVVSMFLVVVTGTFSFSEKLSIKKLRNHTVMIILFKSSLKTHVQVSEILSQTFGDTGTF